MIVVKLVILVSFVTVMEINPEEGKVNDANRRKGPKEEMREKIKTIKKLLGEVSALAEICGGR